MLSSIFFVCLYALFNVSGAAIIKASLAGRKLSTINDWLQFVFTGSFIFAFLLIVISALLLFKALSQGNFSTVLPIATAINFLLTAAAGVFFFNDKLSLTSYIGFVLILGGVFLVTLNNTTHEQ